MAFRRLAIRCEKLASTFLAFIKVACVINIRDERIVKKWLKIFQACN
ncbi:MAG: hypothetical protein QXP91_12025 [Candidatus Methanomethylicia archaeon]